MHIDVLCIQETHKTWAEFSVSDAGLLIAISSASDPDDNETVGVGFIASPRIRPSVAGFRQQGPQMAPLKSRGKGGNIM
eukprot:7079232-Pyramimonas_sp.AAC.1